MSVVIMPEPDSSACHSGSLYRLTLEQFHRMIEHDIFGDERVELLDGLSFCPRRDRAATHRLIAFGNSPTPCGQSTGA